MTTFRDITGPVDFGRHSRDYAEQRPGPPGTFYDRLDRLRALRGARALDFGTGPGVIALELAARGALVVGLDISEQQIEAARDLAERRGLAAACRFEVAPAEESKQPDASFDLVTAGTCWHWFDHARALAEVARVLVPGGLLAIVNYIYLAQYSEIVRESEALVVKWNPGWKLAGFNGLFPGLVDAVAVNPAMRLREQFCYDHDLAITHAAWRGRMRTCNGVGSGGMDAETVARFDADLAALLTERHPEPLRIPHRVFCVVAEKAA
ncbi:MAG TPA: class I SAM-dependent methyltransferase [Myxococcota bacterium]|nr:class I SAM-dependent methyltransferase [Myxococcota bacterium]